MFEANLPGIMKLENGAQVKLYAIFKSEAPMNEIDVLFPNKKVDELVLMLTPAFERDKSCSLVMKDDFPEGVWRISYKTKYIKKPHVEHITAFDKNVISALVKEGALKQKGSIYYVTKFLTEEVMKKNKIDIHFFLQPKFYDLILSVRGRKLTYNNFYRFIYNHIDDE